jgi:hypothetical protein
VFVFFFANLVGYSFSEDRHRLPFFFLQRKKKSKNELLFHYISFIVKKKETTGYNKNKQTTTTTKRSMPANKKNVKKGKKPAVKDSSTTSPSVPAVPPSSPSSSKTNSRKEKKAGIVFPVSRAKRDLRRVFGHKGRVGDGAGIYAASVVEYLTCEILELAGNLTAKKKKTRITPEFIREAIQADTELNSLILESGVCILDSGVRSFVSHKTLQKSVMRGIKLKGSIYSVKPGRTVKEYDTGDEEEGSGVSDNDKDTDTGSSSEKKKKNNKEEDEDKGKRRGGGGGGKEREEKRDDKRKKDGKDKNAKKDKENNKSKKTDGQENPEANENDEETTDAENRSSKKGASERKKPKKGKKNLQETDDEGKEEKEEEELVDSDNDSEEKGKKKKNKNKKKGKGEKEKEKKKRERSDDSDTLMEDKESDDSFLKTSFETKKDKVGGHKGKRAVSSSDDKEEGGGAHDVSFTLRDENEDMEIEERGKRLHPSGGSEDEAEQRTKKIKKDQKSINSDELVETSPENLQNDKDKKGGEDGGGEEEEEEEQRQVEDESYEDTDKRRSKRIRQQDTLKDTPPQSDNEDADDVIFNPRSLVSTFSSPSPLSSTQPSPPALPLPPPTLPLPPVPALLRVERPDENDRKKTQPTTDDVAGKVVEEEPKGRMEDDSSALAKKVNGVNLDQTDAASLKPGLEKKRTSTPADLGKETPRSKKPLKRFSEETPNKPSVNSVVL